MAIMGTLFSLMFFSKQFPDVQLFGIFLVVTSDYTQKKYTKKQKQLHGAEEPKLEKKITCLWNPQSVILCNFYTYRPTDVNLLPSSGFLHSEEQQLGQNRSLAIIVQYVSYIWVNYNDLTVSSLESW
jgi:hypothetical protein